MYALKHLQATSGTWCWVVNFSRNGTMYSKRFCEPMYGCSKGARQAAIAWRDQMLAQIKPMTVIEFSQKVRSNNTSGVPGVTFDKTTRQPEGIWQAGLTLSSGKRLRKSFSVLMHGERRAFELAVQARQVMLDDAQDRPYLHAPFAVKMSHKQSKVGWVE
ncbi:MAG: AP2 domain-containing protein [Rhizobacter sp.]